MNEADKRRLYSKLTETLEGCWEFIGAKDSDGYGRIWYINNTLMAHRVSWIIHNGLIPDGLFVLHKCDNPPCCHPDHLELGTAEANTKDMLAKGRYKIIRACKLTGEQAAEIKASLAKGGSRIALSKQFNISLGAIDAIKHGRNWRHLP